MESNAIKRLKEVLHKQKSSLHRLKNLLQEKEKEIEVIKEILSFNYIKMREEDKSIIQMIVEKRNQEIRDFLELGDVPGWMIKSNTSVIN